MIRRAPTSISLSPRDVAEHLERMQNVRDREKAHRRQVAQMSASRTSGFRPSTVGNFHEENWKRSANFLEDRRPREDPGISLYALDSLEEIFSHDIYQRGVLGDGDWVEQGLSDGLHGLVLDPDAGSEDEEGFIPINLAAPTTPYEEGIAMLPHEHHHRSLDISQTRLEHGPAEGTTDELPSFDASTPAAIQGRSVQKLRSRIPLPRSPLYHSRGINSPENRGVGSLVPGIASYHSGLLSQPARRPKSYRPRSESYSYEESERASVGYDETQSSDDDSSSSQPPEEGSNLHEQLSSSPSSADHRRSGSGTSQVEQVGTENRTFYFSSPRLPLPPPFSAVPRNLSTLASLPSMAGEGTRCRIPSTSPRRPDVSGLRASPAEASGGSPEVEPAGSAVGGTHHLSPSASQANLQQSSSGILHNLASLPLRLIEAYRSRSPHSDTSGSESAASTRSRARHVHRHHHTPPRTGRMGSDQFRIYDDRRSASVQPQTPQHLPEARHQSQLHPSYTAPAGPGMEMVIRRSGWGLHRRRRARSDSPAGMETPGFRGLYGGQENVDDEVTFNRAARRLIFLEGSMSSSPDGGAGDAAFVDERRHG